MNQVITEERIQSSEDAAESPRNFIIERLQTEIIDREQENFLNEARQELLKWCSYCSVLFVVFTLFQIHSLGYFGKDIPFIPFVVFELGYLIFKISRSILNKNIRKELPDILNSLGSFIFWVMVFVYMKTKSFNAMIFIAPLVLFNILGIIFRSSSMNSCLTFSFNVSDMQLTLIARLIKVISVLFISLKLSNVAKWSWFGILWPIWITLGLIYVVSAFIFGIAMGSICSYLYRKSQISQVLVHLWLLYSSAGGAICTTLTLVHLINDHKFSFFWISAYLFFFLVLTFILFKSICEWWVGIFFEAEQYSIPSLSASNQYSLPISTFNSHRNKNKVHRLPPKTLQRLTSTYFQPMEEKRKYHRTLSDDYSDKKISPAHLRTLSSPNEEKIPGHAYSPSDLSFAEKKCAICFEGDCNAVLMECGHGGICTTCAEFLIDNKGKCHMCRSEISQVLKIKIKKSKIVKVVGIK